jgi:nucleoid-associated protein YgaU
MARGKKLAVVLSVVAAGASVALLFRKDAAEVGWWGRSAESPFEDRVERRVTPTDWSRRTAEASSGRSPLAVPAAAISEPDGIRGDGAADSQPAFHKQTHPVGALLAPIEGIVDDEEQDAAERDEPAGEGFRHVGSQHLHTVVDGDTLSKLAARYLGRSDAYLEIFELNRGVLSSPDLLPIGAKLRIPPAKATAPPTDVAEPARPLVKVSPPN